MPVMYTPAPVVTLAELLHKPSRELIPSIHSLRRTSRMQPTRSTMGINGGAGYQFAGRTLLTFVKFR
jgi:hypothetical protein